MTTGEGKGTMWNIQRHVGIVLAVASLGLAACASAKDEPPKSGAKSEAKQAENTVAPVEDALAKAGAKQVYTTDLVRLIAGRTVYGTGSTGRVFMI